MLTMTVMQHEGEAVKQLSSQATDDEDVLSRLRYLHQTLKECQWRVQVVDHALCTQGDRGQQQDLQTQTENDGSFVSQTEKDRVLQDQVRKNSKLQLLTGADLSPHNAIIRTKGFKQYRKTVVVENKGPNNDGDDQNEVRQESENQVCKVDDFQKSAEGKCSQQGTGHKDEEAYTEADNENIHDVCNAAKRSVVNHTTDDTNTSNLSIKDHIVPDYDEENKYVHNETKEKVDIQGNTQNYSKLNCTTSLEKTHHNELIGEVCLNLDVDDAYNGPPPTHSIDTVIVKPPRVSGDLYVDEIPLVSSTTTDTSEFYQELTNQTMMSSQKMSQESSQTMCDVEGIRYRLNSTRDCENTIGHEGDEDDSKTQKNDRAFHDPKQENMEVRDTECYGLVSPVASCPENEKPKGDDRVPPSIESLPGVAQRVDVIWDTIESLRSHFLALHSSLEESSSFSQDTTKSSENSSIRANSPVIVQDYSTQLHQMTMKTVQCPNVLCKQCLPKGHSNENYPHCVCQNLSKDLSNLHPPLETPINTATLNDTSTHTRIYWQGCRESCLFVLVIVLVLLLVLFLATCLLLVLPVVTVSVRTAGGLPAF